MSLEQPPVRVFLICACSLIFLAVSLFKGVLSRTHSNCLTGFFLSRGHTKPQSHTHLPISTSPLPHSQSHFPLSHTPRGLTHTKGSLTHTKGPHKLHLHSHRPATHAHTVQHTQVKSNTHPGTRSPTTQSPVLHIRTRHKARSGHTSTPGAHSHKRPPDHPESAPHSHSHRLRRPAATMAITHAKSSPQPSTHKMTGAGFLTLSFPRQLIRHSKPSRHLAKRKPKSRETWCWPAGSSGKCSPEPYCGLPYTSHRQAGLVSIYRSSAPRIAEPSCRAARYGAGSPARLARPDYPWQLCYLGYDAGKRASGSRRKELQAVEPMGNVVRGRDTVNPATMRAKAFFAPSLVLAVSLELTYPDANSPSECRGDETLSGQFNLYMGESRA